MSISYRLLTSQDYSLYRKIRLSCLKNFPDNFGTTYEEESDQEIKNFASPESNYFIYGAFDDDELIGICAFFREQRLKTRHRGDIRQVYIDPAYSGLGIARALLKITIEKAFEEKEIEQITLSVVSENQKAVSLYKQFGFVQYGFIEDYFKKDDLSTSQIFMILTRKNYFLEIVP